jgi:hypothetical protein
MWLGFLLISLALIPIFVLGLAGSDRYGPHYKVSQFVEFAKAIYSYLYVLRSDSIQLVLERHRLYRQRTLGPMSSSEEEDPLGSSLYLWNNKKSKFVT